MAKDNTVWWVAGGVGLLAVLVAAYRARQEGKTAKASRERALQRLRRVDVRRQGLRRRLHIQPAETQALAEEGVAVEDGGIVVTSAPEEIVVEDAPDEGQWVSAVPSGATPGVEQETKRSPWEIVQESGRRAVQAAETVVEDVQEVFMPGVSDTARAVARETDFSPATVQAIMDVESRAGPDAIRFEPHIFHRWTTVGTPWSTEAQALRPEQAKHGDEVPWTPANWPKVKASKVGAETNDSAFWRAYKVDPEAAVRSTSWGLFQVLDPIENLGAPSWREWMNRWGSEDHAKLSTELFFGWFERNPGVKTLVAQAENAGGTAAAWLPFALKYNGPTAVETNRYHEKLAAAYRQYA